MRRIYAGFAALLLLASAGTVCVAQPVPDQAPQQTSPIGTPADDGPTLGQTFEYLAQKLSKTVPLTPNSFFKLDSITFRLQI
ncbi:MAG TPA: hypothetical protein VGL58_08520 [Caulobacteraceae bacterium]|jgi:hypothetical protein